MGHVDVSTGNSYKSDASLNVITSQKKPGICEKGSTRSLSFLTVPSHVAVSVVYEYAI